MHHVYRDVIAQLKINKFVETGTFVGETVAQVSGWLSELDPSFGQIIGKRPSTLLAHYDPDRTLEYPIFGQTQRGSTTLYSIDNDADRHRQLAALFADNPNIKIVQSSSQLFLQEAIGSGELRPSDRCFFYLDAHWGEYWPLRDEITEILKLRRAVIAIDDFVVPRHPFYGFDVYRTNVCGWYYISDLLDSVDPIVYYPNEANPLGRGNVLIFVGYEPSELAFMRELPFFQPRFFRGAPFTTAVVKVGMSILVASGQYDRVASRVTKKWAPQPLALRANAATPSR
jgi:hypothetical protein